MVKEIRNYRILGIIGLVFLVVVLVVSFFYTNSNISQSPSYMGRPIGQSQQTSHADDVFQPADQQSVHCSVSTANGCSCSSNIGKCTKYDASTIRCLNTCDNSRTGCCETACNDAGERVCTCEDFERDRSACRLNTPR